MSVDVSENGDAEELATWFGTPTGMSVRQFYQWNTWMQENHPRVLAAWQDVLHEQEETGRVQRRLDRRSRWRLRLDRLRMALR